MSEDRQPKRSDRFRGSASATRLAAGLMLLSLSAAGCADSSSVQLAECEGRVRYRNQPVRSATVLMTTPDGKFLASGVTDGYGWFKMSTEVDGELRNGAPVGTVMVSITKYVGPSGTTDDVSFEELIEISQGRRPNDTSFRSLTSKLPEQYANFETSGLQETVSTRGKDNRFSFDLSD